MIALMILTAVVVYVGIAWFVIKHLKTKRAKWIAIVVFALIPTGDQILGRTYFYTLCAMEGGNLISRTVTLPPELFKEDGRPRLVRSAKPSASLEIADRYAAFRETQTISSVFRIERDVVAVRDVVTDELLGTRTSFLYFGGWLYFGAHRTGDRCPDSSIDTYGDFYGAIFKQASRVTR